MERRLVWEKLIASMVGAGYEINCNLTDRHLRKLESYIIIYKLNCITPVNSLRSYLYLVKSTATVKSTDC